MKKTLFLVAVLAVALTIRADLGPWSIGYTNPSDVIAYIEVINNDSTLRICPDASSNTHGMKRFYAYQNPDTYEITGTNVPWENEAEHIHQVVIEDGVTSIDDYAFYSIKNVRKIYIPSSVGEVSALMFDRQYAYATTLYVDRESITSVISNTDYYGPAGFIEAAFHSSITVVLPSSEAVADFTKASDPDHGGNDWWNHFQNYMVSDIVAPKAAVETQTGTEIKATITVPVFGATELEIQSVTYGVLVENQADPNDVHDLIVEFSASEDKWIVQEVFYPGGQAPRRMPVIKRDTVSRTTESLQIDITNLQPASNYNYNVVATNSIGETIGQVSGAFHTPAKTEPMDAEHAEIFKSSNHQIIKFIRDGQLFILREDKTYNLHGAEVK